MKMRFSKNNRSDPCFQICLFIFIMTWGLTSKSQDHYDSNVHKQISSNLNQLYESLDKLYINSASYSLYFKDIKEQYFYTMPEYFPIKGKVMRFEDFVTVSTNQSFDFYESELFIEEFPPSKYSGYQSVNYKVKSFGLRGDSVFLFINRYTADFRLPTLMRDNVILSKIKNYSRDIVEKDDVKSFYQKRSFQFIYNLSGFYNLDYYQTPLNVKTFLNSAKTDLHVYWNRCLPNFPPSIEKFEFHNKEVVGSALLEDSKHYALTEEIDEKSFVIVDLKETDLANFETELIGSGERMFRKKKGESRFIFRLSMIFDKDSISRIQIDENFPPGAPVKVTVKKYNTELIFFIAILVFLFWVVLSPDKRKFFQYFTITFLIVAVFLLLLYSNDIPFLNAVLKSFHANDIGKTDLKDDLVALLTIDIIISFLVAIAFNKK